MLVHVTNLPDKMCLLLCLYCEWLRARSQRLEKIVFVNKVVYGDDYIYCTHDYMSSFLWLLSWYMLQKKTMSLNTMWEQLVLFCNLRKRNIIYITDLILHWNRYILFNHIYRHQYWYIYIPIFVLSVCMYVYKTVYLFTNIYVCVCVYVDATSKVGTCVCYTTHGVGT